MGFFGGALKTLTGGSDSKSQSTSNSGYGALPQFQQDALKSFVGRTQKVFNNGRADFRFDPLAQTDQETQAFNLAQLPTTQNGVTGLTNNFLNPLTEYLTNGINMNYNADNSSYLSSLADSGWNSNNRLFANTAYNDYLRNQAVGSTLANSYQGAQNTALNQNQQNIQNLLGQGEFQRGLDTQGNQAPINALMQYGQLLGFFPATSQSNSSAKSSSVGGIGSLFGGGGAQ